jgi:hypothetical protein
MDTECFEDDLFQLRITLNLEKAPHFYFLMRGKSFIKLKKKKNCLLDFFKLTFLLSCLKHSLCSFVSLLFLRKEKLELGVTPF